jgi:hypothetical protein
MRTDNSFYGKSVLQGLYKWNLLHNAEISGGLIIIHPNGSAGVACSDFASGLKQSKYRRIYVDINGVLPSDSNYKSNVYCKLVGAYSINGEDSTKIFRSINLNPNNSAIGSNSFNCTYDVEMPSYDLTGLTFYIVNKTDSDITINTCYMYRSIDINESQVVGSVGFGVTISQVKAYLDGCEVYFEGESAPLKLWWHGDQSDNFDGVNVNNERLVSFTKVNSILTD